MTFTSAPTRRLRQRSRALLRKATSARIWLAKPLTIGPSAAPHSRMTIRAGRPGLSCRSPGCQAYRPGR